MKKLSLLATLLLTLEAPALTADNCEIAWQVAEQAATSFAKDQAAGLKLFIQAQQFCPEDAGLNYNLGMAYAEYGRAVDALPLLERAVQGKEATAIWRNNLAAVLFCCRPGATVARRFPWRKRRPAKNRPMPRCS